MFRVYGYAINGDGYKSVVVQAASLSDAIKKARSMGIMPNHVDAVN